MKDGPEDAEQDRTPDVETSMEYFSVVPPVSPGDWSPGDQVPPGQPMPFNTLNTAGGNSSIPSIDNGRYLKWATPLDSVIGSVNVSRGGLLPLTAPMNLAQPAEHPPRYSRCSREECTGQSEKEVRFYWFKSGTNVKVIAKKMDDICAKIKKEASNLRDQCRKRAELDCDDSCTCKNLHHEWICIASSVAPQDGETLDGSNLYYYAKPAMGSDDADTGWTTRQTGQARLSSVDGADKNVETTTEVEIVPDNQKVFYKVEYWDSCHGKCRRGRKLHVR